MKYEQGKVMAVSPPHADVQPGNYGKMLVDISIQTAGGKQDTYSVSDTERTAYAGTLLLTCDKECAINEVRAIKAQAEQALAKVAEEQKTVGACKLLLEELDTAYKDKQETEQRFKKIDERFSGMETKMDRILKLMETRT